MLVLWIEKAPHQQPSKIDGQHEEQQTGAAPWLTGYAGPSCSPQKTKFEPYAATFSSQYSWCNQPSTACFGEGVLAKGDDDDRSLVESDGSGRERRDQEQCEPERDCSGRPSSSALVSDAVLRTGSGSPGTPVGPSRPGAHRRRLPWAPDPGFTSELTPLPFFVPNRNWDFRPEKGRLVSEVSRFTPGSRSHVLLQTRLCLASHRPFWRRP